VDAARVELEEIPVMGVGELEGEGGPGSVAAKVFERLERCLETLRGRKFYGLYYPQTGEYRACVALRKEDDPTALGFIQDVIPRGVYLRTRIRGEPDEIYPQIPSTFAELAAKTTPDPTRPSVEYYRRRTELDLLLPILD
jgi:hypothetical protein